MHARPSSIVAALALALVLSLSGCPGGAGGKTLEKSELSTLAQNKTRAEVLATFGPPTSVGKSFPGFWYYEDRTVLVDGKAHSFQLNFTDGPEGKVSAIQYHAPGALPGESFRRPYAAGD